MVNLIIGKKGSGKTKRLIARANDTDVKGSALFVTDTDRYMYELKHEIKFINASDFGVSGEEALVGFLCGVIAASSDVTDLFIDGAHRMSGKTPSQCGALYEKLEELAEVGDIEITVTVSADKEELPDFFLRYREL